MLRITGIVLACLFFAFPAQARQHHRHHHKHAHHIVAATPVPCSGFDVMRPCAYQPDFMAGVRAIRVTMHKEHRADVIGGRPPGCPHAYCGCSASLRVFGRIIPALNLAANWLGFKRAPPAPGMVAARNHHVMVLEQYVGGSTWMVHDGNSGGHLTRMHERSIAGYTIVDPRG